MSNRKEGLFLTLSFGFIVVVVFTAPWAIPAIIVTWPIAYAFLWLMGGVGKIDEDQ